MKTPISKSVLAVVLFGLVLIAGLVAFRLHSPKLSAPPAPPVIAEKASAPAPLFKPTPAPAKADAVTQTDNSSLAVIPVSLTNFLGHDTAYIGSAMDSLPRGTQTLGGIEFWLQGIVRLQGITTRDHEKAKFPTSIVVPLDETNMTDGKLTVNERGRSIAAIYLVGGSLNTIGEASVKIADVVWHYDDGTAARSPIESNNHVRDWVRQAYEQPAQLPNPLTKVAWHGPHPKRKNLSIRIYRVAFINPHPEKTIRALEFASSLARPSLFVCALTLDPLLPGARPDDLTSEEMTDPELNGSLQLSVQDDAGHLLPNATVNATSHSTPAGTVTQKFTTDNNGLALVKFPDTGLESLEVSAIHDDFSGRKMLWDLKTGDTVPPSYTLKLSGEVKIGGLVVDEQETPISGVTIRLYRYWSSQDDRPDKKGEQPNFPNTTVTTDSTGRWEAKGLPPALLDHIGLEAKHPDYIGEQLNIGGSGAEKQLRAETHKMILKHGLEVTGRVLDDTGNPISGATVFGGYRYYRERQQMTTGDDGQFHFNKMSEGQVEFSVTAKGRLPAVKTVNVKPGMAEIVFRLGPGKLIQGIVQNAAGEPLAGTRIDLEDANGGVAQAYEFATTSGSDGRFTWDGAPDEPVHCYFYHSGYEQKRGVLLKTDSDNIVVLQKSRTIQGQVVDADTGNPITKFRVGVGRDPGSFGGTFYPDSGMKDYSDANGKFTLQLDEEYDTYIDALADDYAEAGQTLPAAQNDTVQVTLKLKQSPALRGVVVSPDGQPLPGVSVALLNPNSHGGGVSLSGTKLRSYNQNQKVSITDDQGKFVLPSPPDDATVLAVGEAGFANVPVDEVRQNPNVTLLPFGRIEGTLKISGQPGVGKDVMLMLGLTGIGTDWGAYKQTTDDQGRFTMEHVPPGDVQVTRAIATSPNSTSYSDATSVTVSPGETAQVTLGDKGAVLVGRIRYQIQPTNDIAPNIEGRLSQPMPAHAKFNSPAEAQAYYNSPEWKALAKQRKNYTAEVHPDGSFEIDDVVPGTYSLNVDARVGGERSWEHQPFAQGSLPITVPDSFDPTSPMDVGEVAIEPVQSH